MSKKPVVKIGLIGFGVVGEGVWKHIQQNRSALERRLGARLQLVKVAVQDMKKKRKVQIPPDQLTTDPMSIANNPDIDIVCELMGGTTLAKKITLAALHNGKIVVTANKALICKHGAQLFKTAREGGGHYFYEASVAGGIPIIKVVREGLVANRFNLIYGILNGTCNYILTRMERENLTFDKTLIAARELGYVEADESLDLDGWDTAHKAVILSYLAHGKWVSIKDVPVEGIVNITLEDIQWANKLGFKIKLLGIISQNNEGKSIFVRVHPTLIRKDKIMANVDGVYNAVSVNGDIVGSGIHIGRGAGQDATASAVIGDVADAVNILLRTPQPMGLEDTNELYTPVGSNIELSSLEDVSSQYYLRLSVTDKPGVLAEISTVMANHDVSIASMIQPEESSNQKTTLILTTHQSNEKRIQDTVRDLEELKNVHRKPFLLRIVNFD